MPPACSYLSQGMADQRDQAHHDLPLLKTPPCPCLPPSILPNIAGCNSYPISLFIYSAHRFLGSWILSLIPYTLNLNIYIMEIIRRGDLAAASWSCWLLGSCSSTDTLLHLFANVIGNNHPCVDCTFYSIPVYVSQFMLSRLITSTKNTASRGQCKVWCRRDPTAIRLYTYV